MAKNFAVMKRIKANKSLTEQNKAIKLEPLVAEISLGKNKILDMLMRKNNMIQWYEKLP